MYEAEYAELYDLIHAGRKKDYRIEVKELLDLIRDHRDPVNSLLDVACGTGSHMAAFGESIDRVEGLDLSEPMLEIAGRKVPAETLHRGTMNDFDLGRTFDVVTCLFSSIAHVRSQQELQATAECFARHLEPGGLAVIEPFWFRSSFIPGYVASDLVTVEGRTAARVSHSVLDGGAAQIEVHCVVADAGAGIRHFVVHTRVSLFEREEYEAAFRNAGYRVEFMSGGPAGRGLFLCTLEG
ncbi:class I SAM-dependent DNA methyltransferase [Spirillospora sp. NPDC050679]